MAVEDRQASGQKRMGMNIRRLLVRGGIAIVLATGFAGAAAAPAQATPGLSCEQLDQMYVDNMQLYNHYHGLGDFFWHNYIWDAAAENYNLAEFYKAIANNIQMC